MSVDKEKSFIKYLDTPETEKVKIEGVFESIKTKQIGDREILLPYRIRIVDNKGKIVSEDETLPTLYAKDWSKKFYLNKKGYIAFTRDHNLLAIVEILRAKKNDIIVKAAIDSKFNINDLEGVEFEAVVSEYEENRFIDWIGTFRVNGVEVPDLKTKTEDKVEPETTVDPNDLPF